ncbi:uncharacterized protein CPUR_01440 [Claviceps purpurea 20.1]|uniref:Protein FAF1 n=1 Tax=Claviceps purpurea (strain 20.1) TaxID=1111077 RepID=M1VZB3_CLAP2|nr:uncharacterized protein CPUR_01440 [Claviceps purpurea 20.1]
MALSRKRKAPSEDIDAHELLRRHFEARFEPLAGTASQHTDRDEPQTGEDDSEWDGLSEGEANDQGGDNEEGSSEDDSQDEDDWESSKVEVVDYSRPQAPKEPAMTKRELKAFMSSRPPDPTTKTPTTQPSSLPSNKSALPLPEDAPSLLKQDLELRRLLSESHLLNPHARGAKSLSSVSSPSTSSSSTTSTAAFAEGRTRRKTTDLRVQALGAKTSIHTQEKMPMQMRKGMLAAQQAREVKRRREARENGVILEKDVQMRGGDKKRRRGGGRGGGGMGGVDRPGVGRMRGAELRISERDVRGIEGGRDVFGRRGRR